MINQRGIRRIRYKYSEDLFNLNVAYIMATRQPLNMGKDKELLEFYDKKWQRIVRKSKQVKSPVDLSPGAFRAMANNREQTDKILLYLYGEQPKPLTRWERFINWIKR